MGVMNEDRLTLYDGLIKTHITNTTVAKETGKGLSTNDYTTTEKNKLAGIDKDLLDKLGESAEGNLTFNGDEINAAQMTGATAEADGTSGTVPAPTAGQENHVLKGNGAWEALAYDSELSAESENAPQTKVVDAKTKEIEKNLSQLSNPNLLVNPDFRVNTKKFSGTASYEFTTDHWFANDITITPNDGYVTLVQNGTSNPFMVNRFTDDFYKQYISEKVVTVSIKLVDTEVITKTATAPAYKSNGRTSSYFLDLWGIGVYSIESSGESGLGIYPNGSTVALNVEWVKLELGSIATPFVPPNHDVELYKCLGASDIYSNPNLLINSDFKINQRGITSISSGQFCADRWIFAADSAVVTINDNGITIPVSSGNRFFTQRFEKPLNTSKPIIFTVCINGITHYMRRVYIGENFQYGDVINGATLVARVFSDGSDFTFGVTGENTDSINISYVKLEYGSIPTPFVPPDPASELLKCQRYGEQIYLNAYLPNVYSGLYELNIQYSKKRTSAPTITSVDSGNVRFELISSNNCLARASTEAAYVSSIFVDSEIY